MRWYLHETGELESPRWRALCKSLKASDPGDVWRLYGHLCGWWSFWSGQAALETGLWFDVSLGEIGRWARAEGQEIAWGRALLSCGYIARIEDRYPPPLARQGFVALSGQGMVMLDDIFTYFCRRPDAGKLALYISAPVKRLKWAQKLGLDVAALDADGAVPPGWLGSGPPAVGSGQWAGGSGQWAGGSGGSGATLNAQRSTSNFQGGRPPRVPGVERPVVGFAAGQRGVGTAKPPSLAMLEDVRTWKYQDPMRACLAMDSSRSAETCWRMAIARDKQAVMDELGSLVETDGRWQALKNPAAVLMSSLRRKGLLDG